MPDRGLCANLTGRTDVTTSADEWRHLLAASTADYSTAWHLIAPHRESAFLQPPADSVSDWDVLRNPIALDAQLPVKEFDVKVGPLPGQIGIDLWLFALVATQTISSSNSPHYPQTSRMNGGLSSRLFVDLSGTARGPFQARCPHLAVRARSDLKSSPGYAASGGIAFTWLVPWTGTPIPKDQLDPLFVDTPRRVQLAENSALTTASPGLRTIGKEALGKGLTGDPWAPVDETRSCTCSVRDLSYRTVAPILTGRRGILPSLMQIIRPDDPDPLQLRLSV